MNIEPRIVAALHPILPAYMSDASIAAIARRLAAELDLRQEFVVRHGCGGGAAFTDETAARRFLAAFVERPPGIDDPGGMYTWLESRWVTEWEASR
jgi:hypothetical protein